MTVAVLIDSFSRITMALSGQMRRTKTGGVLIVIPAPEPESRGRGRGFPPARERRRGGAASYFHSKSEHLRLRLVIIDEMAVVGERAP